MHFPATAWQENCISRFPAERFWCLIANPLPARAGDFLFGKNLLFLLEISKKPAVPAVFYSCFPFALVVYFIGKNMS